MIVCKTPGYDYVGPLLALNYQSDRLCSIQVRKEYDLCRVFVCFLIEQNP